MKQTNGIRAGGVFWGVFLICIGALFLFKNLGMLHFDIAFITKFWPLMIVFWGLSIMTLPQNVKKIIAGAGGMLTAVILFAFIYRASDFADYDISINHSNNTEYNSNNGADTTSESGTLAVASYNGANFSDSYRVPLSEAIKKGEINFKGGGGAFFFGPTGTDLINSDLKINSTVHDSGKIVDSTQIINLDLADDFGLNPENGNGGSAKIYLNRNIPWDVNVNAGLSKLFLDFSDIEVRNLNCDAGIAKMTVKVGGKSKDLRMHVNTGITTIRVLVPDSIGCKIKTDGELFWKNFPGFTSQGNGIFTTPGYDTTKNTIQIDLSGGISRFSIARY